MDFSGWIPVTPAKPIPTRPQPNSGERQGNQPNGTNLREQIKFPTEMFHEAPAVSNGAAACLDSISLIAQNSGLSNWETALGGKIPGSQSLKNAAVGWNNIPFADLLALADAACPPSEMQRTGKNAASSPFFPFPYSPIDRNLQQPHAPTTLPMNQNYTISSMQTNNNSKWPPQISQYGFPIPYRPTYDLNSPRKIADADSNGAIFQFAPVTPDHGRKVQGIQHPEVANILLDESPCQENNKLQNAIPERNNAFEQHREESKLKQVIDPSSDAAPELLLQQVVDSSPAALSTPSKENNQLETAQENGIDLNKTPAQKTRRKKHRPRVVIEGKPKRGPKTTVKPAVTDETPRKKRKYVRRNGVHASETPSADVGEITDTTPHSAVKSCKRALNFDYEEQTRIGSHGTTLNHHEGLPQSGLGISSSRQDLNCNPEPRAQDFTKEINGCTGIKSSVQLAKGLEVIVENSRAGIAFDLNRSLTQMLDEYISLPETQQTTRKHQQLEDCEVLTRNIHSTVTSGACENSREKNGCHSVQDIHTDEIRNSSFPKESAHSHENDVPSTLQSDQHARPQSQNKSNDRLHILVGDGKQATGSKRGHSHTSDVAHLQSMNLTGTHVNRVHFNQIFQSNEYQRSSHPGLLFPEICKKRRTEKSQANIKVRAPSSVLAMVNDEISNQFMSNFNNRGSTPKYGSTKNTENLRNGVSSSIHNAYSQSMGMVCSTERIPDKIPPQKEAPRNANTDKSQVSEFLLTSFGQVERNTKKRSKGPTRVRDFKSLAAILHCNALPLTAPKAAPTSGGQGIEIFHRTQKCIESLTVNKQARMAKEQNNKETAIVNSLSYSDINQLRWREHQVAAYGYCQPLAISRGQIEVAQQFNSPIDELAQKMNHLSFKDVNNKISVEKQNALVPYNHGQMVPYEGLFDPAKKRRPRPKVDLDPETDRVWKLLMGKEASEERDTNKEKWWAEERRIFSGRVDSFIARMHLIQGDRRFSQWNGSVVDSVIGVFLTQNVSDHLSSSAFMSLAARFPLKSTSNNTRCNEERTSIIVEEPEMLIIDQDDAEWQEKTSKGPVSDQGSVTFQEAEYMKDNKTGDSKESCGITEGGCWEGISKMRHESPVNTVALDGGKEYQMSTVANRGVQEELVSSQSSEVLSKQCETPERTTNVMKEIGSLAEPDDGRTLDDVVSSQNSVDSCVPQTDELVKSCSDSNSEEEDPTTRNSFNASFVELLQMARTNMLQQYSSQRSGNLTLNSTSECGLNQPETVESNKRPNINQIDAEKDPFSIFPPHSQFPNTPVPVIRSSNYYLHFTADSRVLEVDCPEIMGVGGKYLLSSTTESAGIQDGDNVRGSVSPIEETRSDITARQKVPSNTMVTPGAKQCPLENKEPVPPLISTGRGFFEKNPLSCSKLQGESNKTFQSKGNPTTEPGYSVDTLAQSSSSVIQKGCSDEPNSSGESICVVETLLVDKQKQIDRKMVESTLKEQVYDSYRESSGTAPTSLKAKGKLEKEKKKAFDWDSLRKEVLCNGVKRERTKDRMDSIDWEAVRCADVNEIAKAIKERGMNNMLAERIKDFLNRLVRDHGSIDLEWLRDIPPDKTKEYLLSVRGLGLKSVECVRLLTLHHLAFPVDTNVGRIAVRLGWVPLQPLPESLQLHLLELYPVLETIQKYLWPRLCTLDQRTLYELHYQMITFGKVFCTKSKPNCNACPLRAECKHFASAFASARLALPGPEQKGIVSSTVPFHTSHSSCASINSRPLLLPELNVLTELVSGTNKHEPIIEEPATPESHCRYITESDIEDAFYDDPDEIPTIKLNIEDFATNLQSYMQENMELQEGDMSKALVALTPEAASIPTPKLKNVTRLRTEHQVYELPDSHPLLQGVEKRVPGDVCSYLLAIWTPGETAESIQPPEGCCSSQASGNLCNEATCFSCNSIREANSQTVRGTLLIPCKTAMRGSFPLNGTYFQVNEVFADHESSLNPIDVPRNMLWNLPRRTVYFGTSIPTIFKGQTTEEIQSCFWRGYVCVRGFDQKTRAPRPLMARLHFPASRLIRTKTKASQE